jgi:hypothetical protein
VLTEAARAAHPPYRAGERLPLPAGQCVNRLRTCALSSIRFGSAQQPQGPLSCGNTDSESVPLVVGSSILMPSTFTMPGWLQAWVKVNPVTHLADAVRG